jgi:hypothetical protein
MENGVYIIGQVKGLKSTPWAKDPNKFNHSLGLVTGIYKDEWDNQHENIIKVDIQEADLARVKNLVDGKAGKQVSVPVVGRARPGGKSGAWLSYFLPQGADLVFLGQASVKAASGS